ncbi:MAG: trypsin-like peptidase domain-containing protein [Pseudomarimonas sp.]
MNRIQKVLSLTFLIVATAQADAPQVSGETAWADTKAAPDLRWKHRDFPAGGVALIVLERMAQDRVDAVRRENAAPGQKALRIGIERQVATESASSRTTLTWREMPDGGQTARIQVISAGAVALRSALDVAALPAGAELRFAGDNVVGPATAVVSADEIARMRQVDPMYWTPVTTGERQTIEIFLPAGADSRWARVSLQAVSHLFVSPQSSLAAAKIGESDACEIDAKCVTNPSAAYLDAKNAVARMVFQTSQGSSLCTGTLLNDTDTATQVPHFFTAAHCFTSQSVANTLTTFWFDEATSCGSGVQDPSVRQVSGGATVQFASVASDVLFLRLNNAPPGGAMFLGWNSAALTANTEVLMLHHPAGDVKKVTLGRVKGFGPSSLASGNFIQAGYTNGTTEGGSSGCGLLTLSSNGYQLRGGLLGGSASCANTGSLTTPENSDDYSRFDQVFPSLQTFLMPSTTPPANIDYTGTWSNPAQSGWGVVILRGVTGVYLVNIYHYNESSVPIWFLSAGALNGSSYNQSLLVFTGPWFGINPFNPSAVSSRSAGNVIVNFTSATTATINYTIDGRNVSTSISKLAF